MAQISNTVKFGAAAAVLVAAGAAAVWAVMSFAGDRDFSAPPRLAAAPGGASAPSEGPEASDATGAPADTTPYAFAKVRSESDAEAMLRAAVEHGPAILASAVDLPPLSAADRVAVAEAVRDYLAPIILNKPEKIDEAVVARGGRASPPRAEGEDRSRGLRGLIERLAGSLALASLDWSNMSVARPAMAFMGGVPSAPAGSQSSASGGASGGRGGPTIRTSEGPLPPGMPRDTMVMQLMVAGAFGPALEPGQAPPPVDPARFKHAIEVRVPARFEDSKANTPDLDLGVTLIRANAPANTGPWQVLSYALYPKTEEARVRVSKALRIGAVPSASPTPGAKVGG
ncbi:MAG: hypothetical protein SFY95_02330 [Planctomycetota bacterium]|nr:hypothetical protein [Planctomycetota bacterium]